MKTAMQELIEIAGILPLKTFHVWLGENYERLLEKEKEQIMEAFKIGVTEGLPMETNSLGYDANEKTYYNKTYNQNK